MGHYGMSYLGYYINILGRDWQSGEVKVDISDENADDRIFITDSDQFSAEKLAREIVDYASSHGISLTTAANLVIQ